MPRDDARHHDGSIRQRDGGQRSAAPAAASDAAALPSLTASLTQDARDEPLFAHQWHLGSPTGFDINLGNVWDDYTGAGIHVAVIDTGIDPTHPDLDGNIDPVSHMNSRTGATGATSGNPQNGSDNHGTAVAGVIAAEDNNIGVVGVAYGATLVPIYTPLTTSAFALNGLVFAENFDVVNNRWGYGGGGDPFYVDFEDGVRRSGEDASFQAYGTAIRNTAEGGRDGLGTIIVFSAGNHFEIGDDVNLSNFTNSRHAITVGATDENGDPAFFSTPGAAILISAPGVDIATTDRPGSAGFVPNQDPVTLGSSDYVEIDGTSFSAPIISAVSALMLQANGGLGARDVQEILAYSARTVHPDAANWQTNGAANWNGGGMTWSYDHGSGLVDAHAAVRLAETWFLEDVFGIGLADPATFTNEATATGTRAASLAIPDNSEVGITSTMTIAGDIVIDHVEIHLDITHTWVGDLVAEVISPAGTTAIILLLPYLGTASENDIDFTFSSTFFWGEHSAGEWTLNVFDFGPNDTGRLVDWTLTAYGDAISVDDTYYYTNEFGSSFVAEDAARRTLSDSGGNDTINIAAVESDSTVDLAAGSAQIAGRTLTIAAGTLIENVIGGDGADVFTGNALTNMFHGGRGDDTLGGGAGADLLLGGDGDDVLIAGQGTFDGGSGTDVLDLSAAASAMAIDLAAGTMAFSGGGAGIISDVEHVLGSAHGDILKGLDDGIRLDGAAGDDELVGGRDVTMVGGAGNDRLVYAGTPRMLDLRQGLDIAWTEIETLAMGEAGDGFLVLDHASVTQLTSGGDHLRIAAQGDGVVFLEGNWILDGESQNGAATYDVYRDGDAAIEVHESVLAVVAASLPPPGRRPLPETPDLDALAPQDGFTIRSGGDALHHPSGMLLSGGADLNGDGLGDLVTRTRDRSYVIFGRSDPVPETVLLDDVAGDGGFFISPELFTLNVVNDLDGDGFGELAWSQAGRLDTYNDGVATYAYSFQFVPGHLDFGAEFDLLSRQDAGGGQSRSDVVFNEFYAESATLASAGDINGDGFGDVLVGLRYNSFDAPYDGMVFVVFGHEDLLDGPIDVATLDGSNGFVVHGDGGYDHLGSPIGPAGDVNGDGFDDLLIGRESSLRPDGPEMLVLFGSDEAFPASIAATSVDPGAGMRFRGPSEENTLWDLRSAGDFNGDGFDDVFIAFRNTRDGLSYGGARSYLVFGSPEPRDVPLDLSTLDGSNGFAWEGPYAAASVLNGGSTGGAMKADAIGDVNGDGFDDLVVGQAGAYDDNGIAYVVFGRSETGSTLDLSAMASGEGFAIHRQGPDALVGLNVVGLGDANGDGFGDFAIQSSNGGSFGNFGFDISVVFGGWNVTPGIAEGGLVSDSFTGRDDEDVLHGDAGDDLLRGAGGNDVVVGGSGRDVLSGDAGNDVLVGGSGADALSGGAGDDRLAGGTGDDTLTDGDGNDLLDGGDGDDAIVGERGSDILDGGAGQDLLWGGDGNDALDGGAGDDTLWGSEGDDTFLGGTGKDRFDGGSGADWADFSGAVSNLDIRLGSVAMREVGGGYELLKLIAVENVVGGDLHDYLYGNDDANTLLGGGGSDRLIGGRGDDSLVGGDGDDTLRGGAGSDTLDGGDGEDWIDLLDGAGGVTLRLDTGLAQDLGGGLGIDIVRSAEHVLGSRHDDVVTGNGGDNILIGRGGADTLDGAGGADLLLGSEGGDRLAGGDGEDTLWGNAGNDTLQGGAGDDRLDGGGGSDWVSFEDAASGVDVKLGRIRDAGGGMGADKLISIENVIGSAFADTLTGDDGGNGLSGGGGDDVLAGGRGSDKLLGEDGDDQIRGNTDDDTLYGGDGDDTLNGGGGSDRLDGGGGTDWADFSDIAGGVLVLLDARRAEALAAPESDKLISIENVLGLNGDDLLTGDNGANVLMGRAGNDSVAGSRGNDTIFGGSGTDRLRGNADDDTLAGEEGNDILDGGGENDVLIGGRDDDLLTGGAGNDRFVFADGDGRDTVTDFELGNDRIDLSGVGAIADFADLMASHVTQVGDDLRIENGEGDHIDLLGIAQSDLSEADFLF
ncbi:MAG: S8 family serine peptidase [Proteobacteria bacterium]|nr:S8 family serine peptidase [Pseudomonadota bacterium]